MSGIKTLVNNCSWTIFITLLTRAGDDPQTPAVRRVCSTIESQQRADVTYGDDQNPYLNGISVVTTDGSVSAKQTWKVLARGGPGTLDNLLNTNSVVEIGFETTTQSFTLTAHN